MEVATVSFAMQAIAEAEMMDVTIHSSDKRSNLRYREYAATRALEMTDLVIASCRRTDPRMAELGDFMAEKRDQLAARLATIRTQLAAPATAAADGGGDPATP